MGDNYAEVDSKRDDDDDDRKANKDFISRGTLALVVAEMKQQKVDMDCKILPSNVGMGDTSETRRADSESAGHVTRKCGKWTGVVVRVAPVATETAIRGSSVASPDYVDKGPPILGWVGQSVTNVVDGLIAFRNI